MTAACKGGNSSGHLALGGIEALVDDGSASAHLTQELSIGRVAGEHLYPVPYWCLSAPVQGADPKSSGQELADNAQPNPAGAKHHMQTTAISHLSS
jgi:hypothetical protein